MHCISLRADNKDRGRNLTCNVASTEQIIAPQNQQNYNKNNPRDKTNQATFWKFQGDYIQQKNVLKRYMQERGCYLSKSTKMLSRLNKDNSQSAHYQTQLKNSKTQRKAQMINDNQKQFLPQLNDNTRFFKPYLQNTKFVDLIVRNKRLIRRGLFDMPIENLTNSFKRVITKRQLNNQEQKSNKYNSKITYHCATLPKRLKLNFTASKQSYKSTRFTNTIQQGHYKKLLQKDSRDPVQYQNSLNRIIAAQTIRQKIFKNNFQKKKIMIFKK